MIEMLEGVPGSGKSYYAVAERFLKWVRSGRRIYIYVDGIYLDRLALFEGLTVEQLTKQITVWMSPDEVRASLEHVEVGSAVILDEVQTIFRSKEKVDASLLRWLETHRHRGIDILLMCQQYGQVTLGVNRLVETTTKFRRLDRFGLKGRYQAAVRGNPEETETIRMFTGRYEPRMYAYYSSYSNAAVKETQRGGSILRSPMIVAGIVGLLCAVGWFGFGSWLSVGPSVKTASASREAVKLPPPPAFTGEELASMKSEAVPAELPVVKLRGAFAMTAEEWVFLTEDGEAISETEVAVRSGRPVSSRMVGGIRVLSGPGVEYVKRVESDYKRPEWAAERTQTETRVHEELDPSAIPTGGNPKHDLVKTPDVDLLKSPLDLR